MATVTWVGKSITRQQVDTLTVGSSTVGHTFITTINGKAITYTAVTGDTTATIATAIQALLAASNEGEFREITWAVPSGATSTITGTGPADGAPFTMTAGGTGTYSRAGTTTPLSPFDAALATNYSGGAVPSAADNLIIELPDVSIKYGLTTLAAIALATFKRLSTATGQIGLPDQANGYLEYRTKELSLDCVAVTIEQSSRDQAQQVRILNTSASAVTLVVNGDGGRATLGSEPVEVRALPANSLVYVTGGGLAVATAAGTVCTILTLRGINAVLRLGSGVTLTTAEVRGGQARLDCSCTTLTVDSGAVVAVGSAAAITTTTLEGGTLTWLSTGSPGTVVVGSASRIDFSLAPPGITLAADITLYAGSALDDSAGRLARPYDYVLSRCTPSEVSVLLASNLTLTVT